MKFLTGKENFQRGKQQKQGGESGLNSNLAGKHIFLAGHPFTLAGQRFSGVVTGGCKISSFLSYIFPVLEFLSSLAGYVRAKFLISSFL